MTKTTIANIELGKKREVSIRDVVLIARAMTISPLQLILDLDQPFHRCDLPGLTDLTVLEAARWYGFGEGQGIAALKSVLGQIRRPPEPKIAVNEGPQGAASAWFELRRTWEAVDAILAARHKRIEAWAQLRKIDDEHDRMEGDKNEYSPTPGVDASDANYQLQRDRADQYSAIIVDRVDTLRARGVDVPAVTLEWMLSTDLDARIPIPEGTGE